MRPWVVLIGSAVLYAAAVAWSAPLLPPEGVPLHFAADGTADRFGSRSEALFSQVALGAVLVGLGAALVVVVRRAPLSLVNVPHKDYWTAEERSPRFRRMLAADLAALIGTTLGLAALIPVGTAAALRSDPVGLPAVALWGSLALYLLVVGLWLVRLARHRYRPGQ